MQKVATFKIEKSFHLTGRGLVAVGHIKEGSIKMGNIICININETPFNLIVTGIDFGNIDNEGNYFVGLLLNHNSSSDEFAINTINLHSQVSYVYEAKELSLK